MSEQSPIRKSRVAIAMGLLHALGVIASHIPWVATDCRKYIALNHVYNIQSFACVFLQVIMYNHG